MNTAVLCLRLADDVTKASGAEIFWCDLHRDDKIGNNQSTSFLFFKLGTIALNYLVVVV